MVRALLEAVGVAVEVKEKDMDAVTAVSGSGPAYVYMMIEVLGCSLLVIERQSNPGQNTV